MKLAKDRHKFPLLHVLNDWRRESFLNGRQPIQYELKHKGVRPFDMIGQRLYSGRICVAQASLEYRRQLFKQTKEYSDGKTIFSFSGTRVLSNIPQLTAIYHENEKKMSDIDAFVKSCELSLSDCIRRGVLPSTDLVEAIATCKVRTSSR
jgi:acyl-CoA oxidase